MCVWAKTKDAEVGKNRPKSILSKMLGEANETEVIAFDSGEDFKAAWKEIAGKEVQEWQQN